MNNPDETRPLWRPEPSYAGGNPPLDDTPYYQPPRERPVGVTIVAVLNFLGAALYAFLTFAAFSAGDTAGAGLLLCLGPVQVALSLAVGVGLWQLKMWGYWLAIVSYGLSIGLSVCGSLSEELTGSDLLGIIIPAAILVYLFQSSVRAVFEE